MTAATRARDHGIVIGSLEPGPLNAITDVPGVHVGHTTVIKGDPGPAAVRTGVTVVLWHPPHEPTKPVFAAPHRLNGNGEMTGLEWVRESGMLTTPIAITNTHSVGVVRDALVAASVQRAGPGGWWLPVVAETWDGVLNDIDGMHLTADHLHQALAAAAAGSVPEGAVGGGTGMICHGFKGGIGTASRRLPEPAGGYTVGVLVQANHGRRERLAINGAPVGRELPASRVPEPEIDQSPGAGSIIVLVATDAPLLPHQCARLAQRAGLGVARTGGVGEHFSGDLFLVFATGNRDLPSPADAGAPLSAQIAMLADVRIAPLFDAVVEATEEAIVNTLFAARTMAGRWGVAHELPREETVSILTRYGLA